jgi:hypothetical protein
MFFNWRASRFICILRFTRWWTSMSNSTRFWIVFMSWDEYHEMRFFVNRSIELSCWDLLLIFWLVRRRSEHSRWIDEFDWSKISWDHQASLLDLRESMRWLDVAYSYSRRGRNTSPVVLTLRSKNLPHHHLIHLFYLIDNWGVSDHAVHSMSMWYFNFREKIEKLII